MSIFRDGGDSVGVSMITRLFEMLSAPFHLRARAPVIVRWRTGRPSAERWS
jgi:hypothetical protein